MKPIFYFLVALTAVLAATTNAQPVLDTDGNVMAISHSRYYVLPVIFGAAGGGLNLASRGDNQCPLFVGQEISEVNRGIPVKFSNWTSKNLVVLESENLKINMDVQATICVQSAYWWVTAAPSGFTTWFITAGPNPKAEDFPMSFFKIEKSKYFLGAYHIVSCPDDNDYCMNVGIINDEYGVRRLALTSTPFSFKFMKAYGTETFPKTMSII